MEEFEVLEEESAKKKRVSFGDIFWFQIIFAFGAASIYFIIKIVDESLCQQITDEIGKICDIEKAEAIFEIFIERVNKWLHLG